jgi:uncharacterized membrane protein
MTTETLTTVVIGYTDTKTALDDFHELDRARRAHERPAYDAAVVERGPDSTVTVVATTVGPQNDNLARAAGLGAVVGVVFAPAVAVAAAGAALGALVGTVVDRFDALSHADMEETHRVVDESTASLIVITSPEDAQRIEALASSRGNRTVVPFSAADIDSLRRELQSEHRLFG